MHSRRLRLFDGGLFLIDGGIETTLIFLSGIELPPGHAKTAAATPFNANGSQRPFRIGPCGPTISVRRYTRASISRAIIR